MSYHIWQEQLTKEHIMLTFFTVFKALNPNDASQNKHYSLEAFEPAI